MPRYIFPAGSVASTGRPQSLTFWRDSTGERNRYTDLTTVSGGSAADPLPNGVVVTDATGAYASFAGPDDVASAWLQAGSGSRSQVTSSVTDGTVGGGSGTYVRPVGQSLILMGDSHMTFCGGTSTATPVQALGASLDSKGFVNWANVMLRHGFRVIGNSGIGAQTSSQIAARFTTDVVAYSPEWVCLIAGTNDTDSAVSIANLTAMYTAARAAGIKVIACTVPPSLSKSLAIRQEYLKTNRFIRDWCRNNPGFVLADIGSAIADQATTWQAVSGYLQADNVHFSPQGAALAGRALADAVRPFVPVSNDVLGSSSGDPTNLLSNPMMTGTGSTAPTGWANVGTNTISYVARTDAVAGTWCQQAVTSTNIGALTSNATVDGSTLSVGDAIYAAIEFECDTLETGAPANKQAITLALQAYNGSSFFANVYDVYWDTGYANVRYPLTSGVLLTPVLTVPATSTLVQLYVQFRGGGNARWHRAAIRKVAASTTTT